MAVLALRLDGLEATHVSAFLCASDAEQNACSFPSGRLCGFLLRVLSLLALSAPPFSVGMEARAFPGYKPAYGCNTGNARLCSQQDGADFLCWVCRVGFARLPGLARDGSCFFAGAASLFSKAGSPCLSRSTCPDDGSASGVCRSTGRSGWLGFPSLKNCGADRKTRVAASPSWGGSVVPGLAVSFDRARLGLVCESRASARACRAIPDPRD